MYPLSEKPNERAVPDQQNSFSNFSFPFKLLIKKIANIQKDV